MAETMTGAPEAPAPAAPTAPAPTTPAPAAPAAAPAKISAKEFSEGLQGGRAQQPPAPAAPATPAAKPEQPRAPDGTFKSTDPAPAAPGAGADPKATPGSPSAAADAPATPTDAAGVPDGHVRIEVPEAFQRNFGKATVVPKELEDLVRFSFNSQVRQKDNERLSTERQQLAARLQSAEEKLARVEAIPAINEKFRTTETYRTIAAEIQHLEQLEAEGLLPQGTTARHRKAVLDVAADTFANEEFKNLAAERAQQESAANGERWTAFAVDRVRNTLPAEITDHPDLPALFREELGYFEGRLRDGYKPELVGDEPVYAEFEKFLKQRLWDEPKFRPLIQKHINSINARSQQARAAAEAETRATAAAAASEQQRAQQAAADAENRRNNPLGNVPAAAVARTSGDAPKMNAKQFSEQMNRRR